MDVAEAIILAGGKGERLKSITGDKIPKSLVDISGNPLLEWELEWLIREGVKHVILATGHLSEEISQKFGNQFHGAFGSIALSYSIEKDRLGTGGAVYNARKFLTEDRVFIINGDVLTNISLGPMKTYHKTLNVKATMLGVRMVSPYGIVHSINQMIEKFEEKPVLDYIIHGGVDLFETEVLDQFPIKGHMEETVVGNLVYERQFAVYVPERDGFWMTVKTQKDYQVANERWTGYEMLTK